MVVRVVRCFIVARLVAPKEQCIPAQGTTLETEMAKSMRSEGTPHSRILQNLGVKDSACNPERVL
jgi:hypothetical protein